MADNVTFQTSALATPPDATVVATDDVGGAQYQRVKVDLGGDGAASPLVRGQQADASSLPVTLSTEGTAQLGSLTEGAPATDTASSGLNGRLQRIAQRLTSILAKLPALGTAGTASSDVITVQGVASMTAVQVGDNSASLSVDWNGTQPVTGSGNATGALRVELPTNGTGVLATLGTITNVVHVDDNAGNLSIDDGGNVITVDGSGSAGTAAAGVVTVQGIASMTPVQVSQATAGNLNVTEASASSILTSVQLIDDIVYTDDTSTHSTGTSKGALFMAAATPTDTSVNANDIGAVAMTTDRRLHVSLQDFAGTAPVTGSGTATGALRVELPTNGTGVIATVGTITNAVTVNSHAVTNAGTFAVQVDGSALTALQKIDDPVLVDDAGFTPATSSVMMAGFEADESGTDSVDEGDAGAGRMTLDRKVIVNPQPHTAGGLSVAQLNGSDGGGGVLVATAQVIKASAGQLYGYYIYNPNAAATFVHFYNTAAASVTVGTTNPLMSVTIPANMAANLALPYGIAFSNAGWSAAATTTAGGNTAPSTGLDVTVFYL